MPAIQELPDDDDAAAAATDAQARLCLDRCLHALHADALPLDRRYAQILADLPPVEACLASAEHVPLPLLPPLLALLNPHPLLLPRPHDDGAPAALALAQFRPLSLRLLPLLATAPATAELAAALASFSSLHDPWTTPATQALASRQLQQLLAASPAAAADRAGLSPLIRAVLRDSLKPLFGAPTPSQARVTRQGRLALRAPAGRARIDTDPPPWMAQRPAAVAILEWALAALLPAGAGAIEAAWPLLLPPVLALLDSTLTAAKTRAVRMVALLLRRLDDARSDLLLRTGMAAVLWDAVLPCLSYLPPLTPSAEAVPLLRAAYDCLLALACHGHAPARTAAPPKRAPAQKMAMLDSLVRDGFLRGMSFAAEHVAVVRVLVAALARIVAAMGVWAARHLPRIVPALAAILADPFGELCRPLLADAANCLTAVAVNCWPRMADYVPECLRGLALCWMRAQARGSGSSNSKSSEDGREGGEEDAAKAEREREELARRLAEAVAVLRAVVQAEPGGGERWQRLEGGMRAAGFAGLFEGSAGGDGQGPS